MLQPSQAWTSTAFPDVVVHAAGRVPILESERFAGAVGRVLQRFHLTDGARLRITAPTNETGPYLVQVNLLIDTTPARVQVRTQGPGDALPLIIRLEQQITAVRAPRPLQPRLGTSHHLLGLPMPGQITCRKSVTPATLTPAAAAATMNAMDYDAHLFIDAHTGEDTIVYRGNPTALCSARPHHAPPPLPDHIDTVTFTADPTQAPLLTETQAVQQVCEHGLPFLFYIDPGTSRGQLLYRRYDTTLSLITPAIDAAEPAST